MKIQNLVFKNEKSTIKFQIPVLRLPAAFCHNVEQDAGHPPMELPSPLLLRALQPKHQAILKMFTRRNIMSDKKIKHKLDKLTMSQHINIERKITC